VQPKPAWVLREVLRLKALMPAAGCRHIAYVFNRRFALGQTVSKSFVAYSVRAHLYEIEVLRRKIKHCAPRAQARNQVWGLDMTGKADAAGLKPRVVLANGLSRRRRVPQRANLQRLFAVAAQKNGPDVQKRGAIKSEVSYLDVGRDSVAPSNRLPSSDQTLRNKRVEQTFTSINVNSSA
jgi:hypothetical protein